MAYAFKNKMGYILLESGKITQKQLEEAIKEHNDTRQPIGEIITKLGFATSEDIAKALAKQLNIPYVELGEDFKLDHEEIRLIPESIARKFSIIPFKKDDTCITIAMKDPLDIEAIDTIRRLTNLDVLKSVSPDEKIQAAINKYYTEEQHIERNIQDIVSLENDRDAEEIAEEIEEDTRADTDADQLRMLANDVPVVRYVNLLLLQAVRDRASDIHFEPGEKEISVRLRVDGLLRKMTPPPKSLYQAVVTRIKILSRMDIAERRLPQDGRFKFQVRKHLVDVRVSSLPEAFGEKLVLRILDKQALLLNMQDIGFEQDTLERFQAILKSPHGIILLTGPTGSGKTTTLYSALNYIKTPGKNIQTVEDPVEYLIEGINQMQTKSAIGLTFANALRSILRQDPDIIMIGEIRDLDTARIAIRAATTGHLVLSTLHTNDAASAFTRLKDIGIETYLIAATVKLIISQRLVRVICEKCKEEISPSQNSIRLIKSVYPDAGKWRYYHGKGCSYCAETGYKGRTSIFEFLEASEPIREMVIAGEGDSALNKKASELGMMNLMASGFSKVRQGITTIEEVLSVCPLPDTF